MTDRINALTVILDVNKRTDDAETLITAIMQMRGVLSVTPNVTSVSADTAAESRVRHDLWNKIGKVFFPTEEGK